MENISIKTVGYKDIPVEKIADDKLEVKQYVESLTEFIKECDTPMTIAIQGDWGSGKTSIMNMIQKEIGKDINTIWFNTWQYSQFQMQEFLPISLLNHFLESIGERNNLILKKISKGLLSFVKNAAVMITDVAVGGKAADNVQDALSNNVMDISKEICDLKKKIQEAVENKLEKNNQKNNHSRIVIFIDDLDRLAPEKAVELLEVLKVFLDIDKCVFVLAVDYAVVVKGLERKYGEKVGHNKGKSFFDKIIQLPFNVPVAHYQVLEYIKDFLGKMGIKVKDDEAQIYCNLIDYSIGFNPRSVKRVFNSFQLLDKVAEKKGLYNDYEHDDINDKKIKINKNDKQRVLFAVLCLQMAYENTYNGLLLSIEDLDETIEDFFSNIAEIEQLSDEKMNLAYYQELKKDINNTNDLTKLKDFLDEFYRALQIGEENLEELDSVEILNLKMILSHSAITATIQENIQSKSNEKWQKKFFNNWDQYAEWLKNNKKISKNLIELYKTFHDDILSLKPQDEKYLSYTPTHVSFRIKSDKKKDNWFISVKPQKKRIIISFKNNLDTSGLPNEIIVAENYQNKFHKFFIETTNMYKQHKEQILNKIEQLFEETKKHLNN